MPGGLHEAPKYKAERAKLLQREPWLTPKGNLPQALTPGGYIGRSHGEFAKTSSPREHASRIIEELNELMGEFAGDELPEGHRAANYTRYMSFLHDMLLEYCKQEPQVAKDAFSHLEETIEGISAKREELGEERLREFFSRFLPDVLTKYANRFGESERRWRDLSVSALKLAGVESREESRKGPRRQLGFDEGGHREAGRGEEQPKRQIHDSIPKLPMGPDESNRRKTILEAWLRSFLDKRVADVISAKSLFLTEGEEEELIGKIEERFRTFLEEQKKRVPPEVAQEIDTILSDIAKRQLWARASFLYLPIRSLFRSESVDPGELKRLQERVDQMVEARKAEIPSELVPAFDELLRVQKAITYLGPWAKKLAKSRLDALFSQEKGGLDAAGIASAEHGLEAAKEGLMRGEHPLGQLPEDVLPMIDRVAERTFRDELESFLRNKVDDGTITGVLAEAVEAIFDPKKPMPGAKRLEEIKRQFGVSNRKRGAGKANEFESNVFDNMIEVQKEHKRLAKLYEEAFEEERQAAEAEGREPSGNLARRVFRAKYFDIREKEAGRGEFLDEAYQLIRSKQLFRKLDKAMLRREVTDTLLSKIRLPLEKMEGILGETEPKILERQMKELLEAVEQLGAGADYFTQIRDKLFETLNISEHIPLSGKSLAIKLPEELVEFALQNESSLEDAPLWTIDLGRDRKVEIRVEPQQLREILDAMSAEEKNEILSLEGDARIRKIRSVLNKLSTDGTRVRLNQEQLKKVTLARLVKVRESMRGFLTGAMNMKSAGVQSFMRHIDIDDFSERREAFRATPEGQNMDDAVSTIHSIIKTIGHLLQPELGTRIIKATRPLTATDEEYNFMEPGMGGLIEAMHKVADVYDAINENLSTLEQQGGDLGQQAKLLRERLARIINPEHHLEDYEQTKQTISDYLAAIKTRVDALPARAGRRSTGRTALLKAIRRVEESLSHDRFGTEMLRERLGAVRDAIQGLGGTDGVEVARDELIEDFTGFRKGYMDKSLEARKQLDELLEETRAMMALSLGELGEFIDPLILRMVRKHGDLNDGEVEELREKLPQILINVTHEDTSTQNQHREVIAKALILEKILGGGEIKPHHQEELERQIQEALKHVSVLREEIKKEFEQLGLLETTSPADITDEIAWHLWSPLTKATVSRETTLPDEVETLIKIHWPKKPTKAK